MSVTKLKIQPANDQVEIEHFIELMVSCINPLNDSAREFKKHLLQFSFENKKPNITQLKKIREDIATAHHLVCDMIAEANRLDFCEIQSDFFESD